MSSPAIELQGVRKTFGPKVAVDNLDLTIEAGKLIGLIGPNGAGKTTTIRVIMSIIFPDSGQVRVLGKASAVESKDRIGYLPEERGLYKKMKVGPFLKYVARLKGINDAGLDGKVKDWLARLGLSDCFKKKSEELSKGMQQKVQFIAAVIHEPDLLILDEPFSGLDPVNSRLLRQLIDEQHRAGRTIIFSTHQMSQAEALCDRVVMIHRGRKVLDNTPAEIRRRFDPRAVAFEPDDGFDPRALSAMPEIAGVHEGRTLIEARVRDGVDAASVIPRLASAFRVRRIEVVRPSLEDVFIEIVQGEGASDEDREALLAMIRADRASSDASGD
jgi:ABC-2 type transport system ATP-binding protein